jgi:TonB family protein
MQTFASLTLAALGALALSAAQAAAPETRSAPDGPHFDSSEELPASVGYDDAYALYEVKLGGLPITEAEQLTRWQDELKAGRARAGVLAGSYLAYRALIPADCVVARETLQRADQLGSDQAPWALARLAENVSCGPVERAQWEPWLKKAVTLDYLSAAQRLIMLYGGEGANADPMQRYLYARVAGGYWQALSNNKTQPPSNDYSPAALVELEKPLSAADRARAQAAAEKLLATMLKRHERFANVTPVEFDRGGASGKVSNAWVGYTVDYRHECQWNLAGNCKGAQRLAFLDLTNKSANFLACKVALTTKDFVSAAPVIVDREVLVGPGATRRLILSDTTVQPDKKAMVVNCASIADLAANNTAAKCRAKLKSALNANDFYPPSAQARGIEGNAVVRYWIPADSNSPADLEIQNSSGDPGLDDAAVAMVRSGEFTKDCDYALGSIKIAFKLNN